MDDNIVLGSRTLRRGDTGSDVELMQNFLKVLPEPIGTQISMQEKGTFGRETEMSSGRSYSAAQALKKFSGRNNSAATSKRIRPLLLPVASA